MATPPLPPMSRNSNTLTVPSLSRAGATVPRPPPDILTYCLGSRMVYVTPGENYEQAIDVALEAFPELRDVDRDRISLEVRVVVNNQHERKTAEIGRSAWAAVIATLARFEIVEVRVLGRPKGAAAAPSSTSPPPYASETGWYSNPKGSQTTYELHTSDSLSHQHSLTSRVADLFSSKSSRCRQPSENHRF